jgi:hypothetical protein
MKYSGLMLLVSFFFNLAWISLRVASAEQDEFMSVQIYRALINCGVLALSNLVCVITYYMKNSQHVGVICTVFYCIC